MGDRRDEIRLLAREGDFPRGRSIQSVRCADHDDQGADQTEEKQPSPRNGSRIVRRRQRGGEHEWQPRIPRRKRNTTGDAITGNPRAVEAEERDVETLALPVGDPPRHLGHEQETRGDSSGISRPERQRCGCTVSDQPATARFEIPAPPRTPQFRGALGSHHVRGRRLHAASLDDEVAIELEGRSIDGPMPGVERARQFVDLGPEGLRIPHRLGNPHAPLTRNELRRLPRHYEGAEAGEIVVGTAGGRVVTRRAKDPAQSHESRRTYLALARTGQTSIGDGRASKVASLKFVDFRGGKRRRRWSWRRRVNGLEQYRRVGTRLDAVRPKAHALARYQLLFDVLQPAINLECHTGGGDLESLAPPLSVELPVLLQRADAKPGERADGISVAAASRTGSRRAWSQVTSESFYELCRIVTHDSVTKA